MDTAENDAVPGVVLVALNEQGSRSGWLSHAARAPTRRVNAGVFAVVRRQRFAQPEHGVLATSAASEVVVTGFRRRARSRARECLRRVLLDSFFVPV